MYTVFLSKTVQKFLAKHPDLVLHFDESLDFIQKNPKNPGIDVKKLVGSMSDYRLRIGKYRFLYRIIEDKVVVYFFDAGSRGDVYK